MTLFAIGILLCLPYFSETTAYHIQYPYQAFTIVIDPGHGGKDSGALGGSSQEKDIALKLGLRLGRYINQYMPTVRVLYTRTTDTFIPLHERINLANRNNADVFFSIHCNSMETKPSAIYGTETFVMGLHRATENLNVAKRENKTILMEQDYVKHYDGYNPNSSEGHIMLSMYQNAYLSQSLALAQKVESQFKQTAKRKSRGVKQAGFLVLRAATMPSILVETGFLSNTTEEAYLKSEKGQTYIASAMYRALKGYKNEVESKTNTNFKPIAGNGQYEPTSAPTSTKKSNQNTSTTPHKHHDKRVVTSETSSSTGNTTIREPQQYVPPQKQEMTIMEVPSIESMYPSSYTQKNNSTTSHSRGQKTSKKESVTYKIQLAAATSPIDVTSGVWRTIKGVNCQKIGSSYKCIIGSFDNLKAAVQSQSYWRKNGFKDAFVIAFRNGQKISLADAAK